MNEVTGRVLADRISKVLNYLKEQKITQYEIEQRINYTSLSKAKNFDRYPQVIIEKMSRQELLLRLLEEFGLRYDEATDHIFPGGELKPITTSQEVLYYIMYYYAFARETVGKAVIRIINKKRVIIDYRLEEHWEGTYEVVENYTFINAVKAGDSTPVKKLICLFSGTKKYGRPILLGTYSTVKRDGFPAAGRILLEKVEQEDDIHEKLNNETDPRIVSYLTNKVFVSKTYTPNSLDDLSSDHRIIQKYAGRYVLFYPNRNHEFTRAELTIEINSRSTMDIGGLNYAGHTKLLDPHTLQIRLQEGHSFTEASQSSLTIFFNTRKNTMHEFYNCAGISNELEGYPASFACFMIRLSDLDNLSEKQVNNFLEDKRNLIYIAN
ncbi:hypothetical protein QQ020_00750 [Fulvivirgaceae bacterium BMA12]|uniref:WYL domain-containing protein n=1 Tax=Agaribacillus aureus TaxID=3051825 RepID=A0ABT8L2P8_9BACT|nr:hypothetical protein [Fulvivirgaceae bacterium BMA12]